MPIITTLGTVRDVETGKLVGVKQVNWAFASPDSRDGKCPECAVKHDASEPHNAQSLAYQYDFYARHARWPTWADAIAHCSPELQAAWKRELMERGAWTEPNGGSS